MIQRIFESFNAECVSRGWITSSVGVAASVAVSVSDVEIILKLAVLVATLVTLILTAVLQVRALLNLEKPDKS